MSSSVTVLLVDLVATMWARRTSFLDGSVESAGWENEDSERRRRGLCGVEGVAEVKRPRQSSPQVVRR
jgi:hypothetical protein